VNTLIVFVLSIPIYILSYWLTMSIWLDGVEIAYELVISESVWALVALVGHFFFVNFALGFYRQYLRLDNALSELAKSRNELQKAYDSLAEATVLEERQRIAKEIHDTAGHSLTTVIMQTESAKLIVESNPEEAKSKIVAANLQARHALEELRDSVHLLSGSTAQKDLREELLGIIHESTDGTGIKIRSDIDELSVSQSKHRFLCNTLKEGISNGLRHGGATAFWFECKREQDKIVFLLSDNGKGADGDIDKGFGLTMMEERACALGGEISFRSEDGEGFEICIQMPAEAKE
jgi:two-component system sensor histidine kinase ChiS